MMDETYKKPEERVLEVTQEEYDEAMAKGWTDNDILKPGKHIFRRRTRQINPRDAQIKTTVFIDGDILQHFRRRAEQPNAAEFQTQINQELRAAMERDLAEEENKLDEIAEKLANNPSN
ncbi:MAG: BrnA antitoxin family protein [Pyrinomonadaceae bacterium]|nr:BrnA antitoxin family protein [Pyrinomonadaceae bacterium]